MILAGVCIVGAAVLMWLGNLDVAFVVAVLGICAWFLNYRMQMKKVIEAGRIQRNEGDDNNED